jgi:hypothetical protein
MATTQAPRGIRDALSPKRKENFAKRTDFCTTVSINFFWDCSDSGEAGLIILNGGESVARRQGLSGMQAMGSTKTA